jgi:hypothetical protein
MGSPYLIEGNITIPNDSTLLVKPGVKVEFQDSYTMFVQGRIIAQGTESDSIIFTAADTTAGFNSIRFLYTPVENDTSKFVYCKFTYGRAHGISPNNHGGALAAIGFGKIIIDHCFFAHNKALESNIEFATGGAIGIMTCSPVIRNCTFTFNEARLGGAIIVSYEDTTLIENNFFINNVASQSMGWPEGCGGAIFCSHHSRCEIVDNTFKSNYAKRYAGAIFCNDNANVEIKHNLFCNNSCDTTAGAIGIDFSFPTLINNTLVNNTAYARGGAVSIFHSSPVFRNLILWGNTAPMGSQVFIRTDDCVPEFYYCDIEGGVAAFGGYPFVGDTMGIIDMDPEFYDPENGEYRLTADISPCIDAGDPDPIYNDPDGSRNDIGGLWPPIPWVGIYEKGEDNVFVYPNPTNGITNIEYRLTNDEVVGLSIFDINGKEVIRWTDEMQPHGKHRKCLDVSNLPTGIYYYRIQAGDKVGGGKMVKMD